MRALILSDIHGSAIAARAALAHYDALQCNRIILLGDTLYHGPRNPLPAGHGPMGVVEALMPYCDNITAVRGNCDADVDLMMLPFEIKDEYEILEDNGFTLFLSHGHLFTPECFPADAMGHHIDAYLYGHTHIWTLEKNFKNVLLVNPGSTSLPKGGNPPTFGFYADGRFSIHELESGKELAAKEL